MNTSIHSGTALISGASCGVGAAYADRLARRGHDLILVAGDRDRLCALACGITDDTGRSVEVLAADLATQEGRRSVERALSDDASITMLVNTTGPGAAAPVLASDADAMERLIALDMTAPMRLACAAAQAFAARGHGTIINIASIAAIVPERHNGAYAGAMAFVLAFSQSRHHELASHGIRVQAVLPSATAAGLWNADGTRRALFSSRMAMPAAIMVDAALAGLDLGESVTVASLPDAVLWAAHGAARQAIRETLSRSARAARYRSRLQVNRSPSHHT